MTQKGSQKVQKNAGNKLVEKKAKAAHKTHFDSKMLKFQNPPRLAEITQKIKNNVES